MFGSNPSRRSADDIARSFKKSETYSKPIHSKPKKGGYFNPEMA